MRNSFCTLFNHKYADKGLVMINSFLSVTKDSIMYVLAMDDICYSILEKEDLERTILISLSDFETDEYLIAKSNRSFAEYCWTCTAGLIEYVLEKYNERICTYVDADLFFYSNPNCLVDEMLENNKSVLIVEHGFSKSLTNRLKEKTVGRFCVEFNTFVNNEEALTVLRNWKRNTLNNCSCDGDKQWGDQYYLQEWPEKYSCVWVSKNKGAGVAPWNINRFKLVDSTDGKRLKVDRKTTVQLIFYHYENIQYLDYLLVNINVYKMFFKVDKKLVDDLYDSYLLDIERMKNHLKTQYNISTLIKIHPVTEKGTDKKKKMELKQHSLERIIVFLLTSVKVVLFRKKDIFMVKIDE